MYSLFAILHDLTIVRIPLSKDSQSLLASVFEEQAAHFLNEDRERHEYAPGFVPSDGGIIELAFELPDSLSQLSPTIPNGIPKVSHKQVENLDAKALVAVNSAKARYAFQSLNRQRLLGPRRPVLLFGADANELKATNGIVLGDKLDALHEDGTLYFTSETVVRRFLNLDDIFRDATDEEIVDLLDAKPFVGFDKDTILDKSVSDTWVRKKVMFIKKSNLMQVVPITTLKAAAHQCGVTLGKQAHRIDVPSTKKELKLLLKFLSEDFLESPLRPKTIFEVSGKRPRKV